MKYLLVLLIVIVAAVLCGAGLAVGSWFFNEPSVQLAPPPTIDPNLAPTPTAAVESLPPELPVQLPPTPVSAAPGGPFSGLFAGTLLGSGGSSAPVSLELVQTGDSVTGTMNIGQGLVIDGGSCGSQPVPSGMQTAAGRTSSSNPYHLDAGAAFSVQGIAINIDLDADLSADGQTLSAQALVDLPFLCGVDPVLSGTFARQ